MNRVERVLVARDKTVAEIRRVTTVLSSREKLESGDTVALIPRAASVVPMYGEGLPTDFSKVTHVPDVPNSRNNGPIITHLLSGYRVHALQITIASPTTGW